MLILARSRNKRFIFLVEFSRGTQGLVVVIELGNFRHNAVRGVDTFSSSPIAVGQSFIGISSGLGANRYGSLAWVSQILEHIWQVRRRRDDVVIISQSRYARVFATMCQ